MQNNIKETIEFKNLLLKHFAKDVTSNAHNHNCSDLDSHRPVNKASDEDSDRENKGEEDQLMNNMSHGYSCMNDHSKEINIYEKSNAEKFEAIELFKSEGDKCTISKNYSEAKQLYKRALLYTNYLIPKSSEEQAAYDSLILRLHLNMALVRIGLEELRKAIAKDIDFVLSKDPKNMKALYRKAKCYLLLDEYDDCKKVFGQLAEANCGSLDSESKILENELIRKCAAYRKAKLNIKV